MIIELLKIILLGFLGYLFYTRIWKFYRTIAFYKQHGVEFLEGIVPIFGSYLKFAKVYAQKGTGNLPSIDMLREKYPGGKGIPRVTGIAFGQTVALQINRPEETEILMINQNKYYDKHPLSKIIAQKVTGDSIIFARSD